MVRGSLYKTNKKEGEWQYAKGCNIGIETHTYREKGNQKFQRMASGSCSGQEEGSNGGTSNIKDCGINTQHPECLRGTMLESTGENVLNKWTQ